MGNRPYTVMGKYYGRLVLNGLRVLPGAENPKGVREVPQKYVEETKQFLEWFDIEFAKRVEEITGK